MEKRLAEVTARMQRLAREKDSYAQRSQQLQMVLPLCLETFLCGHVGLILSDLV